MIRENLKFMLTLCGLPCAFMQAHAAGGHHAVDDAAILEPGQCQFASWLESRVDGAHKLAHLAPSCRAGPVELGASLARARTGSDSGVTDRALQIKWARALNDQWSAGLLLGASWSGQPMHHSASTMLVPLSWQASDAVAVHLNLGRDFVPAGDAASRAGAALEWAASQRWSFIAEHFREGQANQLRIGARWKPHPQLDLDLSHTRSRAPGVRAAWTLGLTRVFGRLGE